MLFSSLLSNRYYRSKQQEHYDYGNKVVLNTQYFQFLKIPVININKYEKSYDELIIILMIRNAVQRKNCSYIDILHIPVL